MAEQCEQMQNEAMLSVCDLILSEEDTQGVSFSFSKGGIHGILGPRGSGKTALMEVLSGTADAVSGEVLLEGEPLTGASVAQKHKIGYVPKDFPTEGGMTVLELLNLVGEARRVPTDKRYRQIKEAMELLEVESLQGRLLSRLGKEELRRVAIAQALLGNPELLLMDEPITAQNREGLSELLLMLGKIKTVVITTADFGVVRSLCRDVVILSDGRVLAEGSLEELEQVLVQREAGLSLEDIYNQLCAATEQESPAEEQTDEEREEEE